MAKKVGRKGIPNIAIKQPRRAENPDKFKRFSLSWNLSSVDLDGQESVDRLQCLVPALDLLQNGCGGAVKLTAEPAERCAGCTVTE